MLLTKVASFHIFPLCSAHLTFFQLSSVFWNTVAPELMEMHPLFFQRSGCNVFSLPSWKYYFDALLYTLDSQLLIVVLYLLHRGNNWCRVKCNRTKCGSYNLIPHNSIMISCIYFPYQITCLSQNLPHTFTAWLRPILNVTFRKRWTSSKFHALSGINSWPLALSSL